MELVLIIIAVCLLGVLANLFGADSRGRLHSREEHAAAAGITWEAIKSA